MLIAGGDALISPHRTEQSTSSSCPRTVSRNDSIYRDRSRRLKTCRQFASLHMDYDVRVAACWPDQDRTREVILITSTRVASTPSSQGPSLFQYIANEVCPIMDVSDVDSGGAQPPPRKRGTSTDGTALSSLSGGTVPAHTQSVIIPHTDYVAGDSKRLKRSDVHDEDVAQPHAELVNAADSMSTNPSTRPRLPGLHPNIKRLEADIPQLPQKLVRVHRQATVQGYGNSALDRFLIHDLGRNPAEMYPEQKPIVIVGNMAVGKSSFGASLIRIPGLFLSVSTIFLLLHRIALWY